MTIQETAITAAAKTKATKKPRATKAKSAETATPTKGTAKGAAKPRQAAKPKLATAARVQLSWDCYAVKKARRSWRLPRLQTGRITAPGISSSVPIAGWTEKTDPVSEYPDGPGVSGEVMHKSEV